MLNHDVFLKGMAKLSSFFRKEDMSDLYLEDYYETVKDLGDAPFLRAVTYLQKNHKSGFFPVPAEFLQAVGDSKVQEPYMPKERQIEVTYPGIPPEVKKMMDETIEKIKKRGTKYPLKD